MSASPEFGSGKYNVVLSDALMGRGTKELFTGLDYDQKPFLNDPTTASRQLKPVGSSYDLIIDGEPRYSGKRQESDSQYILIFDPVKKHFVLHQIDSTFEMRLTNVNAAPKPRRKSAIQSKAKTPGKSNAGVTKKPQKEKPKKVVKEPTPDAEDEESDDGLTIEYPGGKPPRSIAGLPVTNFIPPITISDDESEEDAEYEEDLEESQNQDVQHFRLPSPAANGGEEDVEMEGEDDDLLAKELEQALLEQAPDGALEPQPAADESSESEEE